MTSQTFEHNGLTCRVVLTEMGHHCGYVEVPRGHKLHGVHYTEKVEVSDEVRNRPIDVNNVGAINLFCSDVKSGDTAIDLTLAIDVHGGITYSEAAQDSGGWVFGFDCAHAGDARSPEGDKFGGVWRDAEYVAEHCKALADQLQNLDA